ncbi:Protein pim1 [Cyphellophora attinorum]|uniref:Protein pim1 n=1 Tax=Cyphellophora attinorum TaxID=1664694 RepID=A0A0N1HC76_9EURO|nr:Protein pim1 [Phialophora attinorum]KPI42220.1 Protein pim1 [Phialophora attinorum]
MRPKRAAARKAIAAIEEPTTNGVTAAPAKAAPKKAAATKKAPAAAKSTTTKTAAKTKAVTKPATKKTAAPKTTAAKKEPATKPAKKPAAKANTAVKRKATEEPEVKNAKRSKSESAEAEVGGAVKAPTKARKIAQPKAKKPRVKGPAINSAPTAPLNVYVFGEGSAGELGLGSAKGQIEVKRPRLNPLLDADKVGVVSAAVGGMHTAVLTKNNEIKTWGVNDQGALGRDTNWDGFRYWRQPTRIYPTNVDMTGLEDLIFTQVACTDSATFALTDEGQVYGWGTFRSNEGIFGFDPTTLIQPRPTLIPSLKKITKLATGANHVLALSSTGAVWAWGSGQQNQLGRRVLERFIKNALVPTKVGVPSKMVNVGCGSYHSFAIHENGDVYAWGLNSFGETGVPADVEEGGESDVHQATVVEALRPFGKIVCIEGGAHHTIAVTDRGELLGWGRLDGYQLGLDIKSLPKESIVYDASNNPRILKVPTQIPGIDAVACSAGSDHGIAVSKEGKAYAWGFSTTYQTGLGTDEDVEVATWIDNTAVRGKKLVWSGCGGQFSVLAGLAEPQTNGLTNGVH